MHCLVVGGAGILRPAALALLREGHAVTATARTQASLDSLGRAAEGCPGEAYGIAGDYARPGALALALASAVAARGAFDLALVYVPGHAPLARAALAEHPPAIMVDILTSGHGAPGVGEGDRRRAAARGRERSVRLLLGWVADPCGTRWHTPEEVSAAALSASRAPDGSELVLGALRPWHDRPA
jgi:hypothetical protein